MTRLPNIPKTQHYPGMTRFFVSDQKYIQVYGSGPEADEAIKRHLAGK